MYFWAGIFIKSAMILVFAHYFFSFTKYLGDNDHVNPQISLMIGAGVFIFLIFYFVAEPIRKFFEER